MSNKNILILFIFFLGILSSCNKENFDENTSVIEEFTPTVSVVPYGTWEFNLDTINIQVDSTWVEKVGNDGRFIGFIQAGPTFLVDFLSDTNDPLFEVGVYDFQKLQYQTGLTSLVWEADQVDGTVEITNTEEVYDPVYNLIRNEISGFMTATLTDDNGAEHSFSSIFNKIKQ